MALVDQWREIEAGLQPDWDDARLRLTIGDDGQCDRAAALLAPANPFRRGKQLRLYAGRRGVGLAPETIRRLLRRLDAERIRGSLELVEADTHRPPEPTRRTSLVEAWDAAVAGLPADWSDLYVEVQVPSTDQVDRAALLMSPVNPLRAGDSAVLRFRAARRAGYGASAAMVRRCLERVDEAGLPGEVRILRALSDTEHVYTQGPVWYVGGRSV